MSFPIHNCVFIVVSELLVNLFDGFLKIPHAVRRQHDPGFTSMINLVVAKTYKLLPAGTRLQIKVEVIEYLDSTVMVPSHCIVFGFYESESLTSAP